MDVFIFLCLRPHNFYSTSLSLTLCSEEFCVSACKEQIVSILMSKGLSGYKDTASAIGNLRGRSCCKLKEYCGNVSHGADLVPVHFTRCMLLIIVGVRARRASCVTERLL